MTHEHAATVNSSAYSTRNTAGLDGYAFIMFFVFLLLVSALLTFELTRRYWPCSSRCPWTLADQHRSDSSSSSERKCSGLCEGALSNSAALDQLFHLNMQCHLLIFEFLFAGNQWRISPSRANLCPLFIILLLTLIVTPSSFDTHVSQNPHLRQNHAPISPLETLSQISSPIMSMCKL